ncbi:MAG: PKD domain-containing protein, partial [Ilumatobacteraceae bacterium]
ACGCGGFSYVGSFNYVNDDEPTRSSAYYRPGFVFQQGVGDSPKTVAEAAAHEIGHTLGLKHDEDGFGAYGGHGDWAPIMGTGYTKPVTQWSRGEFAGSTDESKADDLVVMQQHGAQLLADDHPDTLSAGTPIEVGTRVPGIIQTADDVDVFRFDTEGGPVLVSVEPSSISPDLDASLEVYDTSGNLLADVDPPSVMSSEDHAEGLDAWVRLDLAAGTYVVRVDGVGSGDPASDGYSDYASLGRYEVVVFEQSRSANRPPTAVSAASAVSGTAPFAVTFSDAGTADPDGVVVAISWDFGDGTVADQPAPTHVFETPGRYVVTHTVTDDLGASTSSRVELTVRPAITRVESLVLHVDDVGDAGDEAATAVAALRDPSGRPLRRALVLGVWSGADRRWVLGLTDDQGVVRFDSVRGAPGAEYRFTVAWAGSGAGSRTGSETGGLEASPGWTPSSGASAAVGANGVRFWVSSSTS